jgi:hypothetical protein
MVNGGHESNACNACHSHNAVNKESGRKQRSAAHLKLANAVFFVRAELRILAARIGAMAAHTWGGWWGCSCSD